MSIATSPEFTSFADKDFESYFAKLQDARSTNFFDQYLQYESETQGDSSDNSKESNFFDFDFDLGLDHSSGDSLGGKEEDALTSFYPKHFELGRSIGTTQTGIRSCQPPSSLASSAPASQHTWRADSWRAYKAPQAYQQKLHGRRLGKPETLSTHDTGIADFDFDFDRPVTPPSAFKTRSSLLPPTTPPTNHSTHPRVYRPTGYTLNSSPSKMMRGSYYKDHEPSQAFVEWTERFQHFNLDQMPQNAFPISPPNSGRTPFPKSSFSSPAMQFPSYGKVNPSPLHEQYGHQIPLATGAMSPQTISPSFITANAHDTFLTEDPFHTNAPTYPFDGAFSSQSGLGIDIPSAQTSNIYKYTSNGIHPSQTQHNPLYPEPPLSSLDASTNPYLFPFSLSIGSKQEGNKYPSAPNEHIIESIERDDGSLDDPLDLTYTPTSRQARSQQRHAKGNSSSQARSPSSTPSPIHRRHHQRRATEPFATISATSTMKSRSRSRCEKPGSVGCPGMRSASQHRSSHSSNPSSQTHRRHRSVTSGTPMRRNNSAVNSAVGFINFTASDSRRILSGVAPSGSSKTKARREREARESNRRITEAAAKVVEKLGGDWHVLKREAIMIE